MIGMGHSVVVNEDRKRILVIVGTVKVSSALGSRFFNGHTISFFFKIHHRLVSISKS